MRKKLLSSCIGAGGGGGGGSSDMNKMTKDDDKDGTDESKDYRNPNAEDYVLQPGEKRVRFSISEVTFHSQLNPAFHLERDEQDDMEKKIEKDGDSENSPSRFQEVRSRRRDSVFPIENDKRLFIERDSDASTTMGGDGGESPEVDDPFAITDFEEEPSTPWSELSTQDKLWNISVGIFKTVALLGLLYFFVCSLDLLSKGFRLIGGKTAGEIFKQSEILQNPVVGVMIGILTTVLVQSSSTSTSIIVGMVAADFMDVKLAIPLIMGANIGTSITNTIVSFMQAGDRAQFRRAFAGATILDMFNWITVIVLLIVEVTTGYLYHVSKAVVDVLVPDPESGGEFKLLSVLTTPFVDLIVQLDESVLNCWSDPNCTDWRFNASLLKEFCKVSNAKIHVEERLFNALGQLVSTSEGITYQESNHKCDKEFIFAQTSLSDALVGVIVLIVSLIVLCTCLIMIVKVLSSVLRGHVSVIIKKTLNADIPYVPWITGYIAILVGAVMTFLVQSSSVFTSALTPLVGLGVISLKRVYPLTLGSNIGTTTTAVIASFAQTGKAFQPSMQIALCHFFFNVTGILLFYPIPYLRFPIQMAKFLGNATAEYRWFAIVYMVAMFAVLPAVFISLSFAGPIYVIILVALLGTLFAIILVINLLQNKLPNALPPFMRTWEWVPAPLRSLKPYDDLFSRLPCCAKCNPEAAKGDEEGGAQDDFVFYPGDVRVRNGKDNNNRVNGGGNNLGFRNDNDGDNNESSNFRSNGQVGNNQINNNSGSGINGRNYGNDDRGGGDNQGFRGSTESVIV